MEILVTVSVVVMVAPGRSWEERLLGGGGGGGCGVEDFWGAEKVAVRVVRKVVEGLIIVRIIAKSDSVVVGDGSDSGGMAEEGGEEGSEGAVVGVGVGLGLGTVTVAVRVMVGRVDGGEKGSVGENATTDVTVAVAVPVVSVTETVLVNLAVRLLVVGVGKVTFSPRILFAAFSSRHLSPTPSVTFMGTAKQLVSASQGCMSKDPLVPQTPMLPEIQAAWFSAHDESEFRSA